MIDDIWEQINLVKMGIPPPDDQNESPDDQGTCVA